MAFLNGHSMLLSLPLRGFAGGDGAALAWRVLAFLVLALFARPCQAAPTYPPHQVKAVFIFNFAQFVEWPSDAFDNDTSPFIIGVIGNKQNSVALALEQAVKNEKVRNRPFTIVYFPDVASVRKCHLLYIPEGIPAPAPRIFADFQDRRILTIGENEALLRNGGIISFITERKIGLRINLKAARASGLTISSKLLRLAEIVNY